MKKNTSSSTLAPLSLQVQLLSGLFWTVRKVGLSGDVSLIQSFDSCPSWQHWSVHVEINIQSDVEIVHIIEIKVDEMAEYSNQAPFSEPKRERFLDI